MSQTLKALVIAFFIPGVSLGGSLVNDTAIQKRITPKDTFLEKADKMEAVDINIKSTKESVSSVYTIMRKSLVVSDGVSSESIRKTPDATVGDVLKRVSGVSVQSNKFVVVRGLPDRYNITLINGGFVLPTETDRRSFSFDIIPSNLIDNVLVYKTASANLPGDFSGGLVDVSTLSVKSREFQNVTLGIGYGSLSSGRDFYTFGHTGISSAFPSTKEYRSGSLSARREWTSILGGPGNYNFSHSIALPNHSLNYNIGFKKGPYSMVGSITYRGNYSRVYTSRKDFENGSDVSYLLKDTQYTKINLVSGVLNGEYSGKKYSFQSKNIFSFQNENSFQRRGGTNFDNGMDISTSAYSTTNKSLINSQISLKSGNFRTEGSFGWVYRSQPDYRIDPKAKSTGSEAKYDVNWRETYRFWSGMKDFSYGIKSDYENKSIKAGISMWGKSRDFSARVFRYSSETLLEEITNNTDRYNANFGVLSAYGLWNKDIKKTSLSIGLRNETNIFIVNTADFSGSSIKVQRLYNNVLPSFNLIHKSGSRTNLRISGSKAVSRPEFREVSNFSYYDFTRNAQIIGNPNLVQSSVYNGDIKYEHFSKQDEVLSFGFFAKRIDLPIEQIVAEGSTPSNFIVTFSNSKTASILGFEGEIRKRIKKFGVLYSNVSIVRSNVVTNIGERPLQGQSPFTLNLGFSFDIKDISINITENIIGRRISAVGFAGYPDIYENFRGILDISAQYKKGGLSFKLNAGNIIPQDIVLYQNSDRELIRSTTESNFSFAIVYTIK